MADVYPLFPQDQSIHSLPSYLLSRGTQVSNTSWGTLWTLEEGQSRDHLGEEMPQQGRSLGGDPKVTEVRQRETFQGPVASHGT